MKHIMFDIDGTLVDSFQFDELCYIEAVKDCLDVRIGSDWHTYPHVTDRGILMETKRRYGISESVDELEKVVKPSFIAKVSSHLAEHGLEAIPGAREFLKELSDKSDAVVSFATGGWRESAELKLQAAGIPFDAHSFASSNDHFSRIEIMKVAEQKARNQLSKEGTGELKLLATPIYFGDADWDKRACEQLGYQFVLIGNRTQHEQQLSDFSDSARLKKMLLL